MSGRMSLHCLRILTLFQVNAQRKQALVQTCPVSCHLSLVRTRSNEVNRPRVRWTAQERRRWVRIPLSFQAHRSGVKGSEGA